MAVAVFFDGHSIDNQKQKFSRVLTEAQGKTIGINIDMNIQRTYLFLNNVIHKHRTNTKTTKTNGEILKYLYDKKIVGRVEIVFYKSFYII